MGKEEEKMRKGEDKRNKRSSKLFDADKKGERRKENRRRKIQNCGREEEVSNKALIVHKNTMNFANSQDRWTKKFEKRAEVRS